MVYLQARLSQRSCSHWKNLAYGDTNRRVAEYVPSHNIVGYGRSRDACGGIGLHPLVKSEYGQQHVEVARTTLETSTYLEIAHQAAASCRRHCNRSCDFIEDERKMGVRGRRQQRGLVYGGVLVKESTRRLSEKVEKEDRLKTKECYI